jgi:hypothetical protein
LADKEVARITRPEAAGFAADFFLIFRAFTAILLDAT